MRPGRGLLLVLSVTACGDGAVDRQPRVEPSAAPSAQPVRRPVAPPQGAPSTDTSPAEIDAAWLFRELADPATRDAAEKRLGDLSEGDEIVLLRRGLALPDELALEAAKRLEHHVLDADESARFVALLLPHLFDVDDDIGFEELRSALGSSEIGGVLQEIREHETIAGERSLLGALHRQLRAEHLPALVEMALSPDPALAGQAFEELAIVALYTNRHREDVARVFAGRAEAPERTDAIPEALAVALRAILADDALGDVRRPMLLAWALRWLRDVEPTGSGDADFLADLVARAVASETLGADERDQVLLYAIVELKPFAPERLRDVPATSPDVATALRVAALARSDDPALVELRELAARDPLAMALAMELDPFAAPLAFVAGLQARSTRDAYDWVEDVYSRRFLLRLSWNQLPSLGVQPPLDGRLEPALVLRLAERFREVRGSHAVGPFLERLARPGGTFDAFPVFDEIAVLSAIEGPRLRDTLRAVLADGEERDRDAAAPWLARLRDRESEGALLDWLEETRGQAVDARALEDLAEWVSDDGRDRVLALVAEAGWDTEIVVRSELAGIPRGIARALGWRVGEGLQHEAERAEEVREVLRGGDAVRALLLHLDVNPHLESDGNGHLRDPRVVEHLRAWAERREDGRAHWAIGELAIAGDPDGLRQMRDVVQVGRYRWVDDASAESLLVGGGGVLSFWVEEAESNCCRAVVVRRVFADHLRVDVTEEMGFQAGFGVTLGEWLRWRLGEPRWMTPKAGECGLGAPEDVRGLVWSDLVDGYVPAIR